MLSILLPVYNFDIRAFVHSLHQQALESGVLFEILCIDDHSAEAYKVANKAVIQLEKVSYIELAENIGRSKIRNLLATKAQYEWLLFLDCDSKIAQGDFIKNYLLAADATSIVCGGTEYENTRPLEIAQYLRWYYGPGHWELPVVARGHLAATLNGIEPKPE